MTSRIVIVGAGHAGGSVAALLRQQGFAGQLVLIGDEAAVPYQRPPLSKAYLAGDCGIEALELRPDSYYRDADVTLRLGEPVVSIDRAARSVTLHGGAVEHYDKLVLATGSANRQLPVPGASLRDIFGLRGLRDADVVRAAVRPGATMAIVGGGYIGLEVAASVTKLGMKAVVIEREARVLARVASEPLSRFYHELHAAHGTEIITGAEVAAFEGREFVEAVRLSNGRAIACSAALVGIGAHACDELASKAGLECAGGVVVDAEARTSDPDIYAIGDMTLRPLPFYEGRMARLESVPNALEQAKQATSSILGKPAPAPEVPWFWSDQFDAKLQIAGLPFEASSLVVRGSPDDGFAVFHLRGDQVRAVEAVNAPQEFMAGRKLIAKRIPVQASQLADRSVPMKTIAAAA